MKHKTILLVEDDYLDVISLQRTLKKLKVEHTLHVAHNGVDALAMLNGSAEEGKVVPDIILLDINMPKMDGMEFLRIIKSYYSLNSIIVYIMTTSSEEYDKLAAQNLGINGYILKPLDFDNKVKSVDTQALMEELLN
jgi:CheY-like chemotaxis protein